MWPGVSCEPTTFTALRVRISRCYRMDSGRAAGSLRYQFNFPGIEMIQTTNHHQFLLDHQLPE